MLSRLLLVYAVVELAVIFALVSTIGWGWTLLALLVTFLLGWGLVAPLAGSHLIRQIGRLRSGRTEPRDAVNDGALMTLATVLVLVPGLVTTVTGLLLLVPPIRSVAGPGLATIGIRALRRRAPLITDTTDGRDYIDGEVIDVRDFDPPAVPNDPLRGGSHT
ncbi:FxsA family protein [Mycobacterium heidelbergense]|uniref:Membrane protein FxsA n=1 Tax=Mycobacterium heidelbergense TaxID=53376 RepID=A0A1X0DUB8_MYCHE|nr:FxsA family protein [Mycobacterium heidelbergense]MCV7049832.1 FxsA family protein [Mycobacterium heidelbergense]ORA75956.1 membrane protein FxsA [Mycobacterium heidelbergense]BBZ52300.1 membrane protein FxsA [Mycobacterium heidelbergense]